MSWFNQKIYTEDEVLNAKTSEKLPANHQVGDKVWLHIFDEQNIATVIDSVIAGINISDHHEIKYDLFFQIGEKIWNRVNDFRGYVTKPNEYIDVDGGLISASEILTNLQNASIKIENQTPNVKRNHLKLVEAKDPKEGT